MGCVEKILLPLCLASVASFAIPAINRLIPSEQPDGSVVYIRKVGNEHFHYTMTEDSLMVVKDKQGYWNYADENGKSTGRRSHSIDRRDKAELEFLKNRHSKQIRENFESRGWRKVRARMDSLNATSSSSNGVMRAWGFQSSSSVAAGSGPTRPTYDKSLTMGEIRGIVVLVQFSDVKFKASDAKEEYSNYLNQEGYDKFSMAGSVKDFFIANSYGKFTPTFDVVGPITLPKTRDYYGSASTGFYGGGLEDRAPEALSSALDTLIAQNYDFTPYDNNQDGVVDFVYMVYAGIGAADTDYDNAIWPHSYTLSKKVRGTKGTLYTSRYACSNEINGTAYSFNRNTTTMDGIGTFCHEFSHVLGLMDHYNTNDGGVNPVTPYEWDLMDAGSYNCKMRGNVYNTACSPAYMSAFERFSLGWLTPREIGASDTTARLMPLSDGDAYILPTNDNNEYYMIEFRPQEGFDEGLPYHGMLVWHIKYDKRTWANNQVNVASTLGVDLVEADGKPGAYSMNADAFPGPKKVTSISSFKSLNGMDLGLDIQNITENVSEGYVEFKAGGSHKGPEPASSSSEESSSSAESSSAVSSAAESSSSAVSSSSAASSSSVNSSASVASSNSVESSSSAVESSSSKRPVWWESSSSTMNLGTSVAPEVALKVSITDKLVSFKTDVSGRKTLRLFDVNGVLLVSRNFDTGETTILLNSKQGAGVAVAALYADGKRVISRKIQIR